MEKQSQVTKLYNLLSDGRPHNTIEILHKVYNLSDDKGIARPGARVNDLVKLGHVFLDQYGNEITGKGVFRGWKDALNKKVFWYRLKIPKVEPLAETEIYSKDYLLMKEKSKQGQLI